MIESEQTILDKTAIDKFLLLEHLDVLKGVFQDYDALMERLWGKEGLTDSTRRLLLEHKALAEGEDSPLNQIQPIGGVLSYVLERVRTDSITYQLPIQGDSTPVESNDQLQGISKEFSRLNQSLEGFMGHLSTMTHKAPASLTPRVDMLLVSLNSLFKGILRKDWEDVELILNHINMVSTSRDSNELLDRVGRMVREIYNSLNEISNDYNVEGLSVSTEEIPDAVEKLQTVIVELENTANNNLDIIEGLTSLVTENRSLVERAVETLGVCGIKLSNLAGKNPEAKEDLERVAERLESSVRASLYTNLDHLEDTHGLYMKLFASQSFQDLTGQTLKKVIAFIEVLQFQMIKIITKDTTPELAPSMSEDSNEAPQEGPDAVNRLSQEKVDNLLAEMGF